MNEPSVQSVLPFVQLPSRYLGDEFNRIKKNWHHTTVHVALAFPDLYEIASSHFGIPILYEILNRFPHILAERVFAPALDMEAQLRDARIPLCTLESAIPLHQFDIVGFSLLYELNYTNVLAMLDLGGIALRAKDRKETDPVVIAGGPCTCNPEPVADFFDALVIGDGETVIVEMMEAWGEWKKEGASSRKTLLERWSRLKGVYVPSLFWGPDSAAVDASPMPQGSGRRSVERAVVPDLNDAPFPKTPIIPHGRPVHDRLRVEIARGCTRGCRFCQAGMIYRPVRERAPDQILSSALEALKQTGYEDLSLLSLSTGDYSRINPLMRCFMAFGEDARVAVSLPSLRAGSLTPELMRLIRKVRKTGFTIAPEAGSQRLRDVINKNITESDIVETVKNVFAMGWKVIKLYFMIGLPTETPEDLDALVDLVRRLKINDRITLHVSFSTFVPKPHTPFQWAPQIDLQTATERLQWLKARLHGKGIHVKWQDPRASKIEGVWARGDRRLGDVLINAFNAGSRFDGWSDHFNYDRWMAVFAKSGVDPLAYTDYPWDKDAELPWDHIDMGVKKTYLLAESENALAGKTTPDCRKGNCAGCGVCDFKSLRPISYHDMPMDFAPFSSPPAEEEGKKEENGPFFNYAITFEKMGNLRFVGHLEMVKIFIRSFRRAGIPVRYSSGFHPMPAISFTDTLPMGMQSENEMFKLTLVQPLPPEVLLQRISDALPEGMTLVGCQRMSAPLKPAIPDIRTYRVELKHGFFDQNALDWFLSQESVMVWKKNKKGKTGAVDLKQVITDIQLHDPTHATMAILTENKRVIRPGQIMKTVFNLSEAEIMASIITKVRYA